MDGVSGAGSALKGALETQSELASKVISSGTSALPQQGNDAMSAQVRSSAMQEQGIGQKLNISV